MNRFLGLTAIAGMAMVLAGAASAQTQLTPEQKFYNYQQAIVAQQSCTRTQFTQDQYNRLDQRIAQLIGEEFGAARSLSVVQDAKGEMLRTIAYRGGCANPKVVEALALFQRDLAPAVGS